MSNQKVMQKLLKAREIISKTPMKKEGRNKFSNYDYFTPSQVSVLVEKACQETQLLPMFSLKRNDLGYYGELIVADTDSGEALTFTLVTDVPDIKATNSSQKLGGMMTFTERYMKSSAFGIVDNNLDFDAQDNRGGEKEKPNKEEPQAPPPPSKQPLDEKTYNAMVKALEDDRKANLSRVKKALNEKYVVENKDWDEKLRGLIAGG